MWSPAIVHIAWSQTILLLCYVMLCRILLMYKWPEVYHLFNPVSLCVKWCQDQRCLPGHWMCTPDQRSANRGHPGSAFCIIFVFNVHYPEGCCNFFSLLEVFFLDKKIPPRKHRLSASVIQLRDSVQRIWTKYVIVGPEWLYYIQWKIFFRVTIFL